MNITEKKISLVNINMTQEEAHALAQELDLLINTVRPKNKLYPKLKGLFELLDERML